MRAYIVFGSPNREGQTQAAVARLLERLDITQVDYFRCFDRYVAPCCDCKSCSACSGCMIRDEFGILEKGAKEAELLIFAYPVYFEGMPAPMKAVIDRMQQFYIREKLHGRMPVGEARAAAVVTMGSDAEIPVPDGVLTFASRALGAKYMGHALVTGTDEAADYTGLDALIKELQ